MPPSTCGGRTPSARPAARVLFPLDEELALLPSSFSPFIYQCIVRLGTMLPFDHVPAQLAALTGVTVSRETVRRLTEQAGAAQVAIETEEVRQVPRTDSPVVAAGGEVQQLSADGAMAPLVGGSWAEARTLALGMGGQRLGAAGPEVHAHAVSYFCRLCSAEDFIDWAALPLHQRGTALAQTVVAVTDGADWLQELITAHRPGTRLRVSACILDFLHAAA